MGLNFISVHLHRVIEAHVLNVIYITGPGHGGPGLAPRGERRMGANPHANGGLLLRDLQLPDFREYAVAATGLGAEQAESTRVMGGYLRDIMQLNRETRNFRGTYHRLRQSDINEELFDVISGYETLNESVFHTSEQAIGARAESTGLRPAERSAATIHGNSRHV